ncbi:MAG: transglycosylase SLT domain-containing protein [Methylophilaceae bacterium]|nr:transglycosylase SLT domain-containing protein [Methylophilaceae bacterium]
MTHSKVFKRRHALLNWKNKSIEYKPAPIFWLALGVFLTNFFGASAALAFTNAEIETFDNEPPTTRALLERAVLAERSTYNDEGEWQAANLYCEASRQGSAEGQYRLGMLYAFGRGVPQSRDLAASLFTIASGQGNVEAQKMLDTIELSTTDLPPCVLSEIAPEKASKKSVIGRKNPAIEHYINSLPKNKRWVVDLVETISDWYKVDSRLVLSIITAESNFQIQAKSNKEAQGLMQLIPATAERFNVKNAFNASQNVKGGVAYLRWLLSYFRGDVTLAVAAYNAGERAVDRSKGVPPYKETKDYVKKVMLLYQSKRHPFDAKLTDASPLVKR